MWPYDVIVSYTISCYTMLYASLSTANVYTYTPII